MVPLAEPINGGASARGSSERRAPSSQSCRPSSSCTALSDLPSITRVTSVKALPNYQLLLTFDTGEQRRFDMTPFLREGVFAQLVDTKLFNSVHVSFDTIEWSNGVDLCPELLYEKSEALSKAT